MKHSKHALTTLLAIFIMAFTSCTPVPENATKRDVPPPIYPDYTDITIPCNIAPLNFLIRDEVEALEVRATCEGNTLVVNNRGDEVCFGLDKWKAFMEKAAGHHVSITVTTLKDDRWTEYRPFGWEVSKDSINPYLTYRLIEPDYEIFQHLSLHERCVENFDERAISDHGLVGNRCMNCHTYGSQDPNLSMFYIRGEGGGAILNRSGRLSKLNIKTSDMVSGSVYFGFSPNGRYIVFSTNVIIPAFHANPGKRLEVFDSASDVYVADLEHNTIVTSKLLSDSIVLETFPTFSPDGKYIYYCASPKVNLPMGLTNIRYSLCRIAFDEATGTFGTEVDTLFQGQKMQASVCHPRVSPDGRFIVFTLADYGTFPIWHQESDLQLMDLATGNINKMECVNSDKSDTYHSWSSEGRWLVFASKRDDGLYGKPYFCHVDRGGNVCKPFVLPQENPHFYDNNLKSFNAPETGKGPLPFDVMDVKRALDGPPTDFRNK